MVTCVLATDMAFHFKEFGMIKSKVATSEKIAEFKEHLQVDGAEKESFLKWAFHLADISNPTKTWDICKKWTDLLFYEFFNQGDLEKQH